MHIARSPRSVVSKHLKLGSVQRADFRRVIGRRRNNTLLKTGATNKTLNYKLVLQAARQVLAKKEGTNFIEAMESAFNDPA